jgi:phage terminase large subunit-like protein
VIGSTKRILYQEKAGVYRAIPAEAATSHGFNPSAVIFDELHTQPNRDLYDVLKTGQGARRNPLFVSITTAGHDRHSICWEVWDYARKVREGLIDDPHFLPLLYELPEGGDWQDEDVWAAVNPNLGVSVSLEFLREECKRATEVPAYENTFRNLYLNQWTEASCRWLSSESWKNCNHRTVDLQGMVCYGGLDLSSTTDLTALVLAFPWGDEIVLECRFWVPEESLRQRSHRDRVPYDQWARDGWIIPTPGGSVDYDFVRKEIAEIRTRCNLETLAMDPWNATHLAQQLVTDGIEVVEFRQGYASMSSPAKSFETHVIAGDFNHQGNPVLAWCVSNTVIDTDPAGNIKPTKTKSTERIDGAVAAIMAIGVLEQRDAGNSLYRTEGVMYL